MSHLPQLRFNWHVFSSWVVQNGIHLHICFSLLCLYCKSGLVALIIESVHHTAPICPPRHLHFGRIAGHPALLQYRLKHLLLSLRVFGLAVGRMQMLIHLQQFELLILTYLATFCIIWQSVYWYLVQIIHILHIHKLQLLPMLMSVNAFRGRVPYLIKEQLLGLILHLFHLNLKVLFAFQSSANV